MIATGGLPSGGDLTDIFISYSRADRPRVEQLAAALDASGFAIWWDKQIEGGTEFARETETKLNEAAVVLVCWSSTSVNSLWVADEATVGRDKGVLVPIAIDSVAPKLGFRQIQTIDFSGWTGDAGSPEFLQLEQALRAKLPAPAGAPARIAASASATEAPSAAHGQRTGAGAKLPVLIGALVAFAVVAAVIFMNFDPRATKRDEMSIAVLPFVDRSESAADPEYGDWLAELVGSLLGKTDELKVVSQSSASSFKNKAVPVAEIARRLGVAMVVEGSVRGEGDDIFISARLVSAATDKQIWAEVYERKAGNALRVQSEVAAQVAAAVAAELDVKLSPGEQEALSPTTNSKAFEAYQGALKLYRTTVGPNIRNAQRLLNEAVEADPQFALAWALLSRVHSYFYFNQSDATAGRRAAAAEALGQALRLKPDLAEVMLADAYFQYWVERDYEGARVRFEKLSETWPNNADVLTALASITRRQGRWDDSKTYFERAVAIDPLRPGRRVKAAEASLATRDFESALRQLDASLAFWPEPPDSIPFVAMKAAVLQAQGRLDEAGALLESLQPQPDDSLVAPFVTQALLRRDHERAIQLLEGFLDRDRAQGSEGRWSIDLNLYLGDLRRRSGDASGAAANYRAALDELNQEASRQPDSADIQSYLALVHSGLGDGAAAKRHAALAVAAVPVAKDALSGAYYLDVQARVLARLGEEAAIPAIENLMKLPAPSPLTREVLRLDPDFDRLRSNPRFDVLLNSAS